MDNELIRFPGSPGGILWSLNDLERKLARLLEPYCSNSPSSTLSIRQRRVRTFSRSYKVSLAMQVS